LFQFGAQLASICNIFQEIWYLWPFCAFLAIFGCLGLF